MTYYINVFNFSALTRTVLFLTSLFSLSVDVSSPDLFGSIHEDFSLTSVSEIVKR